MAARVTVSSPVELGKAAIGAGDLVELRVEGSAASIERQVEASILTLRAEGLEPSSVGGLAG